MADYPALTPSSLPHYPSPFKVSLQEYSAECHSDYRSNCREQSRRKQYRATYEGEKRVHRLGVHATLNAEVKVIVSRH